MPSVNEQQAAPAPTTHCTPLRATSCLQLYVHTQNNPRRVLLPADVGVKTAPQPTVLPTSNGPATQPALAPTPCYRHIPTDPPPCPVLTKCSNPTVPKWSQTTATVLFCGSSLNYSRRRYLRLRYHSDAVAEVVRHRTTHYLSASRTALLTQHKVSVRCSPLGAATATLTTQSLCAQMGVVSILRKEPYLVQSL